MTSTSALVLLFATLGLLAAPQGAAAQFETPSRAFHNSTAFRLEGRHQTVPCTSCHISGQYAGTPTTCVQCHWVRRKDDRFQTKLGSECQNCHRPVSWTATSFNHAPMAGQPLGSSHRRLACESCHKNGQFVGVAADCQSCHRKDFDATRSPNHAAAGFPTTCDSCHRPNDNTWQSGGGGGGFNHAAVFPLVGRHATAACVACHQNNVYRGIGRECVSCHQTQYNNTRSPSHAAAGFPLTCENCHRATDASWAGAGASGGFNHNAVFALVGVHATQACTACHKNYVYRGTARDCVGCHLPRYNSTTRPNHAAAAFPMTCDSCHRVTDTSWNQGRFNHPQFPITSGRHAVPCAQCHTTPSNYRVFSCTTCHTRGETDSDHRGRAGYVYDSNACYACHANGRAD